MKLEAYRIISKPLYAELEAVYAKFGLNVGKLSASVNEEYGTINLRIELKDANLTDRKGEATTPERERFKQYHGLYALKAEWLGQTIRIGREDYVIAGLRGGKAVKQVVIMKGDRPYFIAAPEVVRFFAMKAARAAQTAQTAGAAQ